MSSMGNVASLSKYILTLPKYKITATIITILSIIYGMLMITINKPGADLFQIIVDGGVFGFITCGLTAILTGSTSQKWVSHYKGINLKLKHSMFLSLSSMFFLTFMSIVGSIIGRITHINIPINSFILGCAIMFAFNFLVLWGVTQIKLRQATLIAFIQPILTFILFAIINVGGIRFQFSIIGSLIKLIAACIIILIAIYLFVKIIEAPMQKNMGFSVLKLLSYFVAHMNEDLLLIEDLFEGAGETIDTLVGIISFKREDNTNKALFISPYVHPGPIGDIGGGNMPTILANRFNEFTMVAHGPSTHDFNPVSIKEIDKIENAVNNGLNTITYSTKASEFKRYNYKKANIGVQFFNEGMIMLSTFAPSGSDDIEFSVGLSIMLESQKLLNTENNIVVDCHNSFNAEKGGVLPGNPELFQLIETVSEIEKKDLEYPIKVGCNQHDCFGLGKEQGIGDSQLKTMVIEVNNQKTAYLLFDSNNMELGFRERILTEIKKLEIVDEIEVMTTDTHSVNTLSNGYNPVGITEKETIIKSIVQSINLAIEDLEPVKAGTKVEKIENIKTFGPNKSTELISTISSTLSVTKIVFPIVFLISIILILVWVFGVQITVG
ncbi:MAG: DUF2070 family protein [archaeon]|nr:DUF2070 family protein [archaeon]